MLSGGASCRPQSCCATCQFAAPSASTRKPQPLDWHAREKSRSHVRFNGNLASGEYLQCIRSPAARRWRATTGEFRASASQAFCETASRRCRVVPGRDARERASRACSEACRFMQGVWKATVCASGFDPKRNSASTSTHRVRWHIEPR